MNEKPRTSTNESKLILPVTRTSALISTNVAPLTTHTTPFNVGVLNVQFLGNKAASINDCIVGHQLDVLAVVESYHDSFETPSVIAATPPDYRVIERARPTVKKQKRLWNIITVVFVFSFVAVWKLNSLIFNYIPPSNYFCCSSTINQKQHCYSWTVYRPRSKPPTSDFIKEFGDLLEHSSSYNHCIIAGDVDVHLDDPTALQVSQFLQLLEDFGLLEGSHSQHTNLAINWMNQLRALFAGPHKSAVPRHPRVKRRYRKKFDVDAFAIDLLESEINVRPPADVTAPFDCYITLKQLVENTFQSLQSHRIRVQLHCDLIEKVPQRKLKQDAWRKDSGRNPTVHQIGIGLSSSSCRCINIHQSSQTIRPTKLTSVAATPKRCRYLYATCWKFNNRTCWWVKRTNSARWIQCPLTIIIKTTIFIAP